METAIRSAAFMLTANTRYALLDRTILQGGAPMKKLFALALVLSMVIGLVPALASGNNVPTVFCGGGTPQCGDLALNCA